jgi:hypothetical protein
MRHANRIGRIGRLGMLAVGLGIGAAVTSTPGVASAEDMQISIDGFDLFPTAGNTATATSGMGDIAIAIGNGADATATGGIFDSAFADGDLGTVVANNGNLDSALVDGTNSDAAAGQGNLDTATLFGNDSGASAVSGDDNLVYVVDTGSTGDGAIAGGFNAVLGSNDIALIMGTGSDAFAGSDMSTAGNFDLAAIFGDMLTASLTGSSGLFDILGG